MTDIKFTQPEMTDITGRIQLYFREELAQDIGSFDAGFLLDFFAREIGVHFYNRGVLDAQQALSAKLDELSYALSGLEKPIAPARFKR